MNNEIIKDMIRKELVRSYEFAKSNPEVVLPDNLDVNHTLSGTHCTSSSSSVAFTAEQVGYPTSSGGVIEKDSLS
jgi:hypothetical protein